jgi:hypothetical protein
VTNLCHNHGYLTDAVSVSDHIPPNIMMNGERGKKQSRSNIMSPVGVTIDGFWIG